MLVGDSGDGPVPHHHQIIAELRQVAMLARPESLTQTHQHQQRSHSPRNSEHGEKAAQLVRRDGPENLAKRVCKVLHRRSTPPPWDWLDVLKA